MKIIINKGVKQLFIGLVSMVSLVSPLLITSCSTKGIVFANYESYLSPNLIDSLHSKYNANMMYYSTNEDIQAKFKKSYDIAVPSTYTVLEMIPQLNKFEWTKFDIKPNLYRFDHLEPGKSVFYQPGADDVIEYAKPYTDPLYNSAATREDKIYAAETDGHNAWSLFTETNDQIVVDVDDYAHELWEKSNHKEGYSSSETLLNYAIPYFLQDWMFAYHGDYLDALPAPNPLPDDDGYTYISDIDWADLTNVIAPKQYVGDGKYSQNANWDTRFQPINHNHVNMEDDSRSVYDMCHVIYDEQKGNVPNVNPQDDSQRTADGIKNVYSQFTNKFNPNTLYLNSDGQQVLYPFANPKDGTDPDEAKYAQSNGAIIYSGDCLYAAMGSGIDDWTNTWWSDTIDPQSSSESDDELLTEGNFHIVKPKDSLVCLDMMVMNKKERGKAKEDNIYKIIRTVTLEGCDLPPDTTDIGAHENDDNFKWGPMDNFYENAYTSPLWNIGEYTGREQGTTADDSFFDYLYPADEDPHNSGKAELLAEINNINYKPGLLELPLSNLTKSNMSMIYQEYKEKV